jgi:hypothetical protein
VQRDQRPALRDQRDPADAYFDAGLERKHRAPGTVEPRAVLAVEVAEHPPRPLAGQPRVPARHPPSRIGELQRAAVGGADRQLVDHRQRVDAIRAPLAQVRHLVVDQPLGGGRIRGGRCSVTGPAGERPFFR